MTRFRWLVYLWALPNTLLALGIAMVLAGRFQFVDGVIEVWGRRVKACLNRMPVSARAMTIGHVVFGQDRFSLRITRRHEHVHVRQYERWGPLFVPAYLLASLYLWMRGRDAYRLNPFEVEAFAVDTPDFRGQYPLPDEIDR